MTRVRFFFLRCQVFGLKFITRLCVFFGGRRARSSLITAQYAKSMNNIQEHQMTSNKNIRTLSRTLKARLHWREAHKAFFLKMTRHSPWQAVARLSGWSNRSADRLVWLKRWKISARLNDNLVFDNLQHLDERCWEVEKSWVWTSSTTELLGFQMFSRCKGTPSPFPVDPWQKKRPPTTTQ